jgi:Monooxygenase af470-like
MVNRGRFTARFDGEFVVFLIGMRINRPWKLRQWLPVARAMPAMLRWLDEHPDAGLLAWQGAWIKGPAVVQYWRSFEHLDRFARAAGEPHLPAWKAWNQAVRASGDVGIWHETYRVHAGEYECIYGNMPRMGLALAGELCPVGSTGQSAARRIGATAVDEPALEPYPNPLR